MASSKVEEKRTCSIIIRDEDNVVFQGMMKKRNEWYMKQERFFVLTKDGVIKYFKDKTLLRGSIILCKESKCIRTSKYSMELQIPSRTYYLFESDFEPHSLDKWIAEINKVIKTL